MSSIITYVYFISLSLSLHFTFHHIIMNSRGGENNNQKLESFVVFFVFFVHVKILCCTYIFKMFLQKIFFHHQLYGIIFSFFFLFFTYIRTFVSTVLFSRKIFFAYEEVGKMKSWKNYRYMVFHILLLLPYP